MCKKYAHFTASSAFQALAEHERMDAILLSHLIAEINLSTDDVSSPASIFLSLLPGPISNSRAPPVCTTPSSTKDILDKLYKRFGNNNFAIHSHLDTIGHGIFPNASRFFNHSCAPNAATRYQFAQAKPVTMEVVALRDIKAGEEVFLTYLDPALLQTRQRVFELTYGFVCPCLPCQHLRRLGPLPSPPSTEEEVIELGRVLQEYVGLEGATKSRLPYKTLDSLPEPLLQVLNESYITSLSEIFSRTSHEGQYSRANETGLILLALYLLIYPKNYPQIGVHLVEMAKTRWNELVTLQFEPDRERAVKEKIRNQLRHAYSILNVMGHEGDGEGRLHEARLLQGLLDQ
ncbi:hypothetical protein AX15_005916 [Amanita polypyramis BW_CC]|nr:hypothetical protein AX15_005916 [Amanita polypyramis BW_CC]